MGIKAPNPPSPYPFKGPYDSLLQQPGPTTLFSEAAEARAAKGAPGDGALGALSGLSGPERLAAAGQKRVPKERALRVLGFRVWGC